MNVRRAIPKDAAAIAKVHVDASRTAYAGIIPADYLAALSYQNREQIWRNSLSDPGSREFTFVVESNEAEVIAFADGCPERSGDRIYRGELRAIYILQRHQRQGHGRRLAGAVARQLLLDGFDSMLVWVLEKNPSRAFYDALGGIVVNSKMINIGGTELLELAYGWSDIHPLVELS
jgi:GNAT superfamily N-acetyltransferase